jgi:Na+/H+ antiporter NhaD/arsenite permease-like protein
MGGAALMVLAGTYYGFLDEERAIEMVDFEVIQLLIGMMMIVGVLMPTGFFEYLAVKAAKIAKGDPWRMMILLGSITTFLSMVVDNVTTILLIVPVTVMIANKLKISAVPLLLSEALLSDVGGTATLVGDPPNILIASAAGFTFNDFLVHLFPVVLVALIASLFALKIMFRSYIKTKPENVEELMKIDEKEQIKDPKTMKRALLVLLFTIVLFLIHSEIGLRPSSVAIIGGILALLVTGADVYKVLGEIEWPTLLFFAGLFIVVGAVDEVGLLSTVAKGVVEMSGGEVVIATLLVLWFAAVGSAIVDNIPLTAAMIPVIQHMGELGMVINPVWWGLAMGVGFGGNGTPIGSSANVVTVGLSEKYGHKITYRGWVKVGTPIMIISSAIGSVTVLFFTRFFY